MRKLILLDIDGTIFNSGKFMDMVKDEFARELKVDRKNIDEAVEEYYSYLSSNTDFNPHHLLKHLSNYFKKDEEAFKSIFWHEKFYSESLYGETLETLKKLKEKAILGIFSQGFEDFQKHKLKASKTIDFFSENHFFISRNKLDKNFLQAIPADAIVVDDKKEVVKKLKNKAIWINRGGKTDEKKIKTIRMLNELLELV